MATEAEMLSVKACNPRITIKFCTQCKWMLRAAYFAQELLSTFATSVGEVALQPSTGGVFTVEIFYLPASPAGQSDEVKVQSKILWDRKTEGGFPEVKELKRRVRDVIDPNRGLGHVDGNKKPVTNNAPAPAPATVTSPSHIKSEEAAQEHSRRNLEEQPGGRRHSVPDSVAAAAATSIPAGEVCDLRKRNPDGSICEDCL